MTLSVQSASVQEKKSNKMMQLTLGGVGLGGVSGAAGGYFIAKPWFKNGRFSDGFIKSTLEKHDAICLKHASTTKEKCEFGKGILKFMFTPNQTKENYIDFCKKYSKELNLAHLSEEELKNFVNTMIKKYGSIDKMQQAAKYTMSESLYSEFTDVKKGIVRSVKNTNAETKEIREMLKGTITKMKKNAAIKWGLIGAIALGLAGFVVSKVSKERE